MIVFMDKVAFIQEIINCKKAKTYLEVGVAEGDVFLKIRAKNKIAVDPKFTISKKRKIRSIFKDFSNIFNRYYEITSDDFFKKNLSIFTYGLDVIFIDGLHNYNQSLKDVQNCLRFLKEDGVIIMHDCNPPFASAAYPAMSWEHAESLQLTGWTGTWCGDVWKTIAYLRATQSNLRICVLDCDYGLGMITKGIPESMLDYSKEEIDKFSYADLEKNRRKILNLKDTGYFKEVIEYLSSRDGLLINA